MVRQVTLHKHGSQKIKAINTSGGRESFQRATVLSSIATAATRLTREARPNSINEKQRINKTTQKRWCCWNRSLTDNTNSNCYGAAAVGERATTQKKSVTVVTEAGAVIGDNNKRGAMLMYQKAITTKSLTYSYHHTATTLNESKAEGS